MNNIYWDGTHQWDGTDKHAKDLGLQTKMCMMRFVTLYGMYRGHDFIVAESGDWFQLKDGVICDWIMDEEKNMTIEGW